MSIQNRDPPLTDDDISWGGRSAESAGQPRVLFFASGFAWYFDEEGEKRGDLTKYGWTWIHCFVNDYGVGVGNIQLQYGIYNTPVVAGPAPLVEQVREPTEFNLIGGIASMSEEDAAPVWPEAWLWINDDAWYIDSEVNPLPRSEALGWQGLHRYLDRYDPEQFRYRVAATMEDTALANPATVETVREMVQPP